MPRIMPILLRDTILWMSATIHFALQNDKINVRNMIGSFP